MVDKKINNNFAKVVSFLTTTE